MKIDGTVTISIDTFQEMQEEIKEKEQAERKLQVLINAVLAVYKIDDKDFLEECKKIDSNEKLKTDKEIMGELAKAREKIKIEVNSSRAKRLLKMAVKNSSENCSDIIEEVGMCKQEIIDKMEIKLI